MRRPNLEEPVQPQLSPLEPGSRSKPQTLQPLTALAAGTCASVAEIRAPPEHRARLLELGLVAGTALEVVRWAPLGDPVEVRVRGSQLVLRRQEAEQIWVQPSGPTDPGPA